MEEKNFARQNTSSSEFILQSCNRAKVNKSLTENFNSVAGGKLCEKKCRMSRYDQWKRKKESARDEKIFLLK